MVACNNNIYYIVAFMKSKRLFLKKTKKTDRRPRPGVRASKHVHFHSIVRRRRRAFGSLSVFNSSRNRPHSEAYGRNLRGRDAWSVRSALREQPRTDFLRSLRILRVPASLFPAGKKPGFRPAPSGRGQKKTPPVQLAGPNSKTSGTDRTAHSCVAEAALKSLWNLLSFAVLFSSLSSRE